MPKKVMKPAILCYSDNAILTPEEPSEAPWKIVFAINTEHAYQALNNETFEAVAAASRPIGKTGSEHEFLSRVMMRFPNPARILLYNPAEKGAITTGNGLIHQCVTVPTSAAQLVSAAQRARFVSRLLEQPAIKEFLPRLRKLPSVPAVYFRLLEALRVPDVNLEEIGRIMAEDFIMTAKLLQVANSAYFGLQNSVTSSTEAIKYLGLARTKALVLVAHIFSAFDSQKTPGFSVEKLWQHSLTVAQFARRVAKYESGNEDLAEAAYTAGLLHDVGKFMIAANCPEKYKEIVTLASANRIPFADAEKQVYGTTHAEIAASILGTWGLPADILEGIAFHSDPLKSSSKTFSVTTAVHVANVLEHAQQGLKKPLSVLAWDMEYLENLGLAHRLQTWKETCAEVDRKKAA
jgi:putative nucleotidyltransferase with HDIG domain